MKLHSYLFVFSISMNVYLLVSGLLWYGKDNTYANMLDLPEIAVTGYVPVYVS
jgi:hypothetical protein